MDYFSSTPFFEHRDKIHNILAKIPTAKEPVGWKYKGSFSVGGFEYLGFNETSDLLFVISSSGRIVIDLSNLEMIVRNSPEQFIIDETFLTCEDFDVLKDKVIRLAGRQGSILPTSNKIGERLVRVSPLYPCEDIIFCPPFEDCLVENFNNNCIRVYRGFLYCFGFSFSGNYFVIADDEGIQVWEKQQ